MTLDRQKAEVMQQGGKKLGEILDKLLIFSAPGVSLIEIEKLAEKLIKDTGGTPSFQTVEDYKFATCLCVNDVVVHGLPSSYKLRQKDILGIDVGLLYKGFHTDASWTLPIGDKIDPDTRKFLEAGKLALKKAIYKAVVGNKIWDISHAIEETIRAYGYSPVKALIGHGVGKKLHEDPPIPCFTRGARERSPKIEEGQTLAIEVIYNKGSYAVVYKSDDGWTISTEDESPSGLFEHTILITPNGPLVLTANGEFGRI